MGDRPASRPRQRCNVTSEAATLRKASEHTLAVGIMLPLRFPVIPTLSRSSLNVMEETPMARSYRSPTSGHDERQRPACTCSVCMFVTRRGAPSACDAGRAKEQQREGAESQE